MLEFFDLGVYFIDALKVVGDFLTSRPLMFAYPWLEAWYDALGFLVAPFIQDFYIQIITCSMAEVIFGQLLIWIFGFKLVKFILDIVL